MDMLLIWLMKVNIAITLLYVFYKLFFQEDTFFRVKRMILLSLLVFSLIYPFFYVRKLFLSYVTHSGGNPITLNLREFIVSETPKMPQSMPLTDIIGIIWIAGMILLLSYFIIQIFSIVSKVITSERIQLNGMYVYIDKDLKTPFSFFKYILINIDSYDEQELFEILHHERTHVEEGHTYDAIFSELFCILCWFNPFVWLLKKEIRLNLEFLADDSVVRSVKDAEHYQLHLLRLSHHKAIAQLSNNFNVSPLKKRIQMMTKEKSLKTGIVKYLLFVPLLIGLMFVNQIYAQNAKNGIKNLEKIIVVGYGINDSIPIHEIQSKDVNVPLDKNVFISADEMPQFSGGDKVLLKYLADNICYPTKAMEQGAQGTVLCRFIVASTGEIKNAVIVKSINPFIEKEVIRIVNSMPKWVPGKQKGKPVDVYVELPVQFKIQK